LLLRAVNLLKAHLSSVTVLGPLGRHEALGVSVLPDRWPGRGPLGALLRGLESSTNDWNVFLACDLPLLNGPFIELLLRSTRAGKFDAVVPRTVQGWHPLCAAYRRTCAATMRCALERGECAIINILPLLQVDVITSERLASAGINEKIFENVNSPEDWRRVLFQMRVHRQSKTFCL
ncbi:MAG: molybdenum cofactor guanylyltransferase, partial [Terriglobia bacterium]